MEIRVKTVGSKFLPDKRYSVEEYLDLEKYSIEKHEFYNGQIVKMSGATPAHNLIAANIITQLNLAIDQAKSNYLVLTSDTQIHIPRFNNFVYPDAVVVCNQVALYPGSSTIITNLILIVEVLSPSTKGYDAKGKFYEYKQIPTFMEYVLVEQSLPYVMSSYKTEPNTWQDYEAEGLDSSIHLKSINCIISLNKIYKSVRF